MIDWATKAQGFAYSGFITMIGGFGQYMYYLSKGKTFSWSSFLVTLGLAFVLGTMLGAIFPPEMPMRDGALMMSGFSVYGILKVLEDKFPKMAYRVIAGIFGFTVPDEELNQMPTECAVCQNPSVSSDVPPVTGA